MNKKERTQRNGERFFSVTDEFVADLMEKYPDNIISMLHEFFTATGIGMEDIRGKERYRHLVDMRCILVYHLKKAGYSRTFLRDLFGREKSTLIHYEKKYAQYKQIYERKKGK